MTFPFRILLGPSLLLASPGQTCTVPPAEFAGKLGHYRSPLIFADGSRAKDAADWARRRAEIRAQWMEIMGPWPELIAQPKLEILETTRRENFTQRRIRVELAKGMEIAGYVLVPDGTGPFPAVFVPYYEPETSVGLKPGPRDFARQLTRAGFVTLAVGSPGGDAWKPGLSGANCQPLSFLAYVAANAHTALAHMAEVDATRIGITGHSYGGKWAMFGACLYEPYACAAWSDPGSIFDETRGNVNYWEPWYLGREDARTRKPGLVTAENPRTGAYARLIEAGHDLHELQALMAPRPFLVSGGAEDPMERWTSLNHLVEVNRVLSQVDRVVLTTRPTHDPTEESNRQMVEFFRRVLRP